MAVIIVWFMYDSYTVQCPFQKALFYLLIKVIIAKENSLWHFACGDVLFTCCPSLPSLSLILWFGFCKSFMALMDSIIPCILFCLLINHMLCHNPSSSSSNWLIFCFEFWKSFWALMDSIIHCPPFLACACAPNTNMFVKNIAIGETSQVILIWDSIF